MKKSKRKQFKKNLKKYIKAVKKKERDYKEFEATLRTFEYRAEITRLLSKIRWTLEETKRDLAELGASQIL